MRKRRGSFYFKYYDYIISTLLGVVPKIILICCFAYPLCVTGDELFLFYLPAKLAGLDWSSSMDSYRYYGYGFNILMTPLFYYIDDPVKLYRSILIILAVLQGVIPIICCGLLRYFFHVDNLKQITVISITCSYMVGVSCCFMYNEHVYIIAVWICFLLLAKLFGLKYRKERVFYSVLLSVSMIFALTIHQRAVTLLLAYIFLNVYTLIFYRKRVGYVSIVCALYGAGYLLHRRIMAWNNDFLVGNIKKAGEEIQNTEVSIPAINSLKDCEYLRAVIRIAFSQINALNFRTLGLGLFVFVLGVYITYILLKKRNMQWNPIIIIFGVFGVCCILMTILGQAFSWGWGVKRAYINNDAHDDGLRALSYTRYFFPYVPPVLLAVFAFARENVDEIKKLFKYNVILSITLCEIWIKDVVPLAQNRSTALETAALALAFRFGYVTESISGSDYLRSSFLLIIAIVVICACFKHKKMNTVLICLCIMTLYCYGFSAICNHSKKEQINYSYADASYELFREVDFSDYKVYVQQKSMPITGQGTLYEIQFLNPKMELYKGIPQNEEAAVYLCFDEKPKEELINCGYFFYRLDENEFIYVKGEECQNRVEEYVRNKQK